MRLGARERGRAESHRLALSDQPTPAPSKVACSGRGRDGPTYVRSVQALAALVILVGAAVALMLRFVLQDDVDRITRPKQPSLFYSSVGGSILDARGVFGVAHNAGDSRQAATDA